MLPSSKTSGTKTSTKARERTFASVVRHCACLVTSTFCQEAHLFGGRPYEILPKQSVPMLLLFGVLLLPLVSDSVPAEDHGNKREAPMRLESLAHGKTELMTYLVSQPIHEGEYGS